MPVCNLAPCEVILADVLHNSLPHISPLLPDTREYGWVDFAATDCDDLICLHPRVLPFSSTLLHLPPARSLWQEPSQLGINPAARFPSLPFITVVGTDPLRRGSRSPEDPLDFRTGGAHAVLVGRAHMYTHTHTHTRACACAHALRENTQEHCGYIICTLLFINQNPSPFLDDTTGGTEKSGKA